MDQPLRGTGIAVASSIEATDAGMGRSLEEDDDDDRRDEAGILDGVRDRDSRRTAVSDARFGGMTMGTAVGDSKCLILSRVLKTGCFSAVCSVTVEDCMALWGGAEVKRKARGTIILTITCQVEGFQ